jgi:spore germination protein GerM
VRRRPGAIDGALTARPVRISIRAMPLIEAPEAALRLARAICSDVNLYNEEKIVKGIQDDNFFDALHEEIEEGRQLYRSRVSPELYGRTNFYDRAIVDVILKSKGHVKSKMW